MEYTIENLYISNLTAEQLMSLLPARIPEVDKIIRDRIIELNATKVK